MAHVNNHPYLLDLATLKKKLQRTSALEEYYQFLHLAARLHHLTHLNITLLHVARILTPTLRPATLARLDRSY